MRRITALAVALALIGMVAAPAAASVRDTNAGELPFYARVEPDLVIADGDVAMVYFYRPPGCIPPDFNLLDFFDVPRVFACGPPTTDGFNIWETEPFLDPAPYQSNLHGLGAVPVWFVDTSGYMAAISDGELTIGELESLDPLVGAASLFTEVLHPDGGANVSKFAVRMKGHLDDGRSFLANISRVNGNDQVNITIR